MTQASASAAKVVLVTGASSGIGKVCAEHLAGCGYRVFGTRRQLPVGAANEQEEANGRWSKVEMIAMDVTSDESVKRAIGHIMHQAGRIDAVVNNAGNAWMGAVEETSIDEARDQLETNFFGVLRVCRAVLPIMRKQRIGTIVNVSSLAGVLGLPFSGIYSASKFALEGMTESLRLEVRPFGIRVALVQPGDFRTGLPAARRMTQESQSSDIYKEAFVRWKTAQDRDEAEAGTPEPVAHLIERILRSGHPPLRQHVGVFMQTIVVPLKRLLPQRLFEWVLRLVLNIR